MGTKERLFWVLIVFVELFAILVFANGCSRPKATAALAPASLAASPVACPEGYKPVSRHDGRAGVDRGNGFTIVNYVENGKSKHLFCTQDDGQPDPRISKSTGISIPESK